VTTQAFKHPGDAIVLLGDPGSEIGASHYLLVTRGGKFGPPPQLDFETELRLHAALRDAIRGGGVRSAHDCSEGGVAVALAECCLSSDSPLGAQVVIPCPTRADVALFNESQSRVVVSLPGDQAASAKAFFESRGVPFLLLGTVIEEPALSISCGLHAATWRFEELSAAWSQTIGRLMGAA